MARAKMRFPLAPLIAVLFGLVLLSLQLMSSATQESSQLNEMYSSLLIINALGSIVLLGLIGVNIASLIQQLKKREAGSKLTIRMVSLFVLLALAPAGIVFFFSMQFLHQGIDSWFNVEIDRAMEDSLELSQASLDQRMRWHLRQTQQLVDQLDETKSETQRMDDLEKLRAQSGAAEMTLFSRQGRIIASSSINPGDILPHLPDEHAWLDVRRNGHYVALDSTKEEQLRVQAIVTVDTQDIQYLQALYPVPLRIMDLADSVEFAFVRYQEMNFLRDSLKLSFSLALSLVLLMSLLAAIWVAFISIRNIVAPVKELVKGTQAIAAGHYNQQLPVLAQDDLGFLVISFNDMAQRIAKARDETRLAGIEVEDQRAYLETILANLTAGVISFDKDFRIRTANQATYRIFHLQVSGFYGQSLSDLSKEHPDLADPLQKIQHLLENAEDIWEQRIAFLGPNGLQELLCRGTPLYSPEGRSIGAVVVFDDVTDLIQAQKNAAWGEVARRLAHEIKNPLTPIQLSAERLQHKLANELQPKSLAILQRSTETIVQQVEAMKEMVDDFSEYARVSKKQTEHINLPSLIQEVLTLYASQGGAKFTTSVEEEIMMINGDRISIRQVLHNLIKNALEATEKNGNIKITVSNRFKNNARFVEMAFHDDGPGIKEEHLDKIFEPYVTTKAKGTGLGLAIVKKIIEEHGGAIWIDTGYKAGAGFVIQLPAV
ncbi:MAG TPA: PAS domain-containing sensor histidine kinase [Methylococcaceae bacterium]|nr:PAS domain-containing sensor histidine kinase [Methylococcaceae bacterium]